MINASEAYRAEVVGDARRTRLRVPLRVVSPDLEIDGVTASAGAACSRPEQVYDTKNEADVRYATLEHNRWILDGTSRLLPEDMTPDYQVGYVSEALSGEERYFASPQTVTVEVSGVSILQAVTLFFPEGGADGVAADFTVTVSQGQTVYFQTEITGNTSGWVPVTGFTVYAPSRITLSVTRWSVPYRRMRLLELVPGYAITWTEHNIASMTVKQQASVSTLTAPYGTASLSLDNGDRIFDPRNKAGLFESLEERQSVPVYIGVDTEEGTVYLSCGVYFRQNRAWTTQNTGMTIRWDLVDILGLLSRRSFIAPEALPETLGGWVAALAAQLGGTFAEMYTVDPGISGISVTADPEDVDGKNCGDILRWACQVADAMARADAETGYIAVEPLWSQGNAYTLDNLEDVPTMAANDTLGAIRFRLPDGELVVSGNTAASADTVTVDNPFIHDQETALRAARHILTAYGGNKLTTVGRGDPSSEVGDVATVELDSSNAVTARIVSQSFDYSSGVLKSCRTEFLQADGGTLYQEREVVTEDGTWTAPAGVTSLYLILIGGGQAGGHGQTGGSQGSLLDAEKHKNDWGYYSYGSAGEAGTDGAGGNVWYGTVSINPGQRFSVHIGAGGQAANGDVGEMAPVDGEATTFGAYSSDGGHGYSPSFTDIFSCSAYGRSGVALPLGNTGDGGAGGSGGAPGAVYWMRTSEHTWKEIPERRIYPGYGTPGSDGGSGCAIIYWNKEDGQ